MKVYNKSEMVVEKAKKVICPRCKGFGRNQGEDHCFICKEHGVCWISNTGWTRALYQKIENSILY